MRRGGPFRHWTWLRRLSAAGFLTLLVLGSFDWFPWFKGSMAATEALGIVPFTDPLALLEMTLTTREWVASAWLGAGLVLSVTVLLGPVFCSWVCPLGLLLDLGQSLRARVMRLVGRGRRRPVAALPSGTRYAVLGLVLGFSLVAQIPIFQILSPINLFARALILAADAALFAVLALAAVELFFPRVWCRSLCPLGALHSLVGGKGLLRVRVGPDLSDALRCQGCEAACPMGIPVMSRYTLGGMSAVDDPACTRCGSCVDACPGDILSLGLRNREARGTKAVSWEV